MNLYEIRNGSVGESYVRVYCWAKSEEQALELGRKKFVGSSELDIKLLFSESDDEFCTEPSDSGFDVNLFLS
ncbi:hypothetical protein HY772_05555 [Candidatus Woesearchaeota archaeon]|nr:hypothetical protein [Candidatus Woesearchaeota archaeon]